MADMVLKVAAKALIVNSEGKVLILREAATYADGTNTGKYHLPGGRLEPGEAFMDGLHREVAEETGLQIEPSDAIHVDEWRPVIRDVPHQIVGVFVLCKYKGGDVHVSDEHDEAVWMNPDENDKYELLDAERAAIKAYLGLRDHDSPVESDS